MPSFPPVSCLYLDARRREGRKSLKKMWKIPNRQPRNTQRQAGPPWSPLIFFFFPQGDQWSPLVPPVGSPDVVTFGFIDVYVHKSYASLNVSLYPATDLQNDVVIKKVTKQREGLGSSYKKIFFSLDGTIILC